MEAHMDSSSGLLVMSGSSCAGMCDFTAMKTPPPPQSDRSFLNTVYSEGKHEYVGSSGLSFDSQPKIMSGFKLSMWLAKMAARSELLMLLSYLYFIKHSVCDENKWNNCFMV